MKQRNLIAIPNPFSKWPSENSNLDTNSFKLLRSGGVEMIDSSGREKYPDQLKDLTILMNFSVSGPGVDIGSTNADYENLLQDFDSSVYFTSCLRLLQYFNPKNNIERVWFCPSIEHYGDLLTSLFNFSSNALIQQEWKNSYEKIYIDEAPNSIEDFTKSRAGKPILVTQNLAINPFFAESMIDKTHDIRKRLRNLLHEFEGVNETEAFDFEKADLISLLKQTLLQLGDGTATPKRILPAVPKAAKEVADGIVTAGKVSDSARKTLNNISSILHDILSNLGLL